MKTFFHQHKIVLLALTGVLCIGILTGLAMAGMIRLSMMDRSFSTVADARREAEPIPGTQGQAAEIARPTTAPTPAQNKLTLSAQDISWIARDIEMRRSYIIPVRTSSWPAQNLMLWTIEEPDEQTCTAARNAAAKLTELLFDKTFDELTDWPIADADVLKFVDGTGDRDAILRVSDGFDNCMLTLRASDFTLICADLFTYPETAGTDLEARAKATAAKLGYRTTLVRMTSGSSPMYESVYTFKTDTDEYLALSYCGDQLWQAAVYPSERAMEECEYFRADIQMENGGKAYPQNFVETDPPKKGRTEMISDVMIKNKLSRLYTKLTEGETLNMNNLTAVFLKDESGVREDCWSIRGEGMNVVISAYSRSVITMECSIPCKSLLAIPYEKMGGAEYEAAATEIARYLFLSLGSYDDGSHSYNTHGKEIKAVSVNAVHDGHACTMDVELQDGTFYELGFHDGILQYAQYYANERLFAVAGPSGWVADNVYLNAYTGKPFIPDYRDWDGDFHVARPVP